MILLKDNGRVLEEQKLLKEGKQKWEGSYNTSKLIVNYFKISLFEPNLLLL